jgi:hypothetical protein
VAIKTTLFEISESPALILVNIKKGISMNQRLSVQLEVIKNERTYIFSIPMGSPYQDALDVIEETRVFILDMQKQALDRAQEQQEEQPQEKTVTEEKVN